MIGCRPISGRCATLCKALEGGWQAPRRKTTDLLFDLAFFAINTSAGLKEQQGLTDRRDAVNADDLHSLVGKGEGAADGAGSAISVFVADELADEAFAGMPN